MQYRAATLLLAIAILLTACATGGRGPSGTPDQPGGTTEGSRAPKTLTLAVQVEPSTLSEFGTNVGAAAAHTKVRALAHEFLVVQDDRDAWVPQLALEQLSVERGTWRVNPDGTMDTTWRIPQNVRWHDGTPFTAEDLLFSFTVYTDPAVPNRAGGRASELMESATAPDPHTLAVHWSAPYFAANQAQGLFPMPRHLLEEVYRQDKDAFQSSPRFTSEWVGLGPYRMDRWEPGAHIVFSRFDGYYRGRAPLDTIVMRFFPDPTAMVANLLASAVDAVLPLGVRIDEALEVKGRWDGTGNQVVAALSGRLRNIEIQHRAEFARPVNGFTNRQVRQAFYQAIDRQTLIDVMSPGLTSPLADSWIPPHHELRPQLEPNVPQFPYDPARAQQLLAQEGWVRGPNGLLVNQAGEPWSVMLWNTQSSGAEREMNVVADSWKGIGAQTELYIVPAALVNDREGRAKLPGGGLTGFGYDAVWTDRLHSRNVTAAANRWLGINRGGYSNPQVDDLLDRLVVTVAPAERLALHRQLLQAQMGDVALMPLYWDLDPILMLKGVKGVAATNGSLNLFNAMAWDKE
jgi:peptide/nickel transport system substrate-binding protein